MKNKLLGMLILILIWSSCFIVAYADEPISTTVILDTHAPTASGLVYGVLEPDGRIELTIEDLSDDYIDDLDNNIEGTGTKTIVWTLKRGSDVVYTHTDTVTNTKIIGDVSVTAQIFLKGDYVFEATLTDWVGNTVTLSESKYLSKPGEGQVSISSWVQGEDPISPTISSSTNDTDTAIIEYKKVTEPDSAYTETEPTTEIDDYVVRVTFPETGIYEPVVRTAEFSILADQGAPHVDILKDTTPPTCSSIDLGSLTGNSVRVIVTGLDDGPFGSGVKQTKWIVRDSSNNVIFTSLDTDHIYDSITVTDYINFDVAGGGAYEVELEIIDYYGNSTRDRDEGNYITTLEVVKGFNAVLLQNRFEYNGQNIIPPIVVSDGATTLTENVDYEIAYTNNKNVGTATAVVTGKGFYQGEITFFYDIYKKELIVSADNKQKNYGAENPPLTYTVTGYVDGEVPAFNGELTTTVDESTIAGEYPIQIGTLEMVTNGLFSTSNYRMTFVPGILTVGNNLISVDSQEFIGVFDGNPQTFILDVLDPATGATIKYGTTQGTYNLTTKPTRTDVGTYPIYYEIVATDYVTYRGMTYIKISPKSIASDDITINLISTEATYDGTPKTTSAVIYDSTRNYTLVAGVDYELIYDNNVNSGITYVRVKGLGNYTGYVLKEFIINKANIRVTPDALSKQFGTLDPELTYSYTGLIGGQTPSFEGKLERVAGENAGQYNINLGTLHLVTTGSFNSNNYQIDFVTGIKFTIIGKPLTSDSISASLPAGTYIYDGTNQTPLPLVYDGDELLVKDSDYQVTYTNNKNAGTATVTVTGINNYTGTLTFTFAIQKRELVITPNYTFKFVDEADPTINYTVGNTVASETPTFNGKLGREPGSAIGTYEINAGTLSLKTTLPFNKDNYTFRVVEGKIFEIKGREISRVDLSPNSFIYDGTSHTPTVTAYDGSTLLVQGTNYTVSYLDNKDAGTATAVVTGINGYQNVINKTFTIAKRSLNIKADNKSKVAGRENPALTYTVTNLVAGETPAYTGFLTTTASISSPIGTYPIERGTLDAQTNGAFKKPNYEIVFTEGTLTVNENEITVVVTNFNGPYDGSPHTISLQVIDPVGRYTIKYSNTQSNYTLNSAPTLTNIGSKTVYFKITCDGYADYYGSGQINIYTPELENAKITLSQNEYIYNGKECQPAPTVLLNSTTLRRDVDYSVSYIDNIDAGTATCRVTGIGSYAGAQFKDTYFLIKRAPLVIKPTGTYTKTYQDADPTFTFTCTGLQNGETVNSTGSLRREPGENVGKYEVIDIGTLLLTSNGNFKPSNYDISFERNNVFLTINPRNISSGTVTFNEETNYTGSEVRPIPTLVVNNTVLNVDIDYTITYSNNTNQGNAQVTLKGIGNYTGTKTANFTIGKINLERHSIEVDFSINPITYVYDGTAKEPSTRVIFRGRELVRNTDYTVSYENNVEVGDNSAIAKITGIGNYEGTLQRTFSITPIETSGVVELSESRFEYDGTAKEPRITKFTAPNGWTLVQGVDFDTRYENNINVGNAKIIITGKNHFEGEMEVGFEIFKTTPVLTLKDKVVTYSGGKQSIDNATISKVYNYMGDATNFSVQENMSYWYYTNREMTDKMTTLPKDIGVYYVHAYLPADENHNEAYSNVAKFVIIGAPSDPIIQGNDGYVIVPNGETVGNQIYIDIFGSEVKDAPEVLIGYQYSEDGNTWNTYDEVLKYVREGLITIYAKAYVVDEPTLESNIVSYSVIIDKTEPGQAEVEIPDEVDTVTLEVEVTGAEITAIYITEDGSHTPTPNDNWLDVSGTQGEQGKTFTELSQGDGQKTLYIWGRDKAGNITQKITKTVWLNAVKIGNHNENETNLYFKVTDEYLHTSDISAGSVELYVNGFLSTGAITNLTRDEITDDPTDGFKYTGVMKNVTGDGELNLRIDKSLVWDKAGNHIAEANQTIETKEITVDNTLPTLRVTVQDDEAQIFAEDEHIKAVMLNGAILGRTNGDYKVKLSYGKNIITVIDDYGNDVSQTINNNTTFIDLSSVPNEPELFDGMKGVIYSGADEQLVGYFTKEMYDYSMTGDATENTASRWANAVTPDGSYWVWIPRFAYKATYYTDSSMTTKSSTPTQYVDYDVIFLRNRSLEYMDKNGNINPLPEGYKVADAFTKNGGSNYELLGFWMAKYEMSKEESRDNGATWNSSTSPLGGGNTLTTKAGNNNETVRVVSKANKTPWRGISVSTAFDNSLKMYPEYKSHLMKNKEYEATLILGISEYGRNGEFIALDSTLLTGILDDTSTTGNNTGVYDMIGGSYEYTSSYINDTSLTNYASSLVNNEDTGIKEVLTLSDLDKIVKSRQEAQITGDTSLEDQFRTSLVVYRGLDYTSTDLAVESIPIGGSPDSRVGYRTVLFSDGASVSDNLNSEDVTTNYQYRIKFDSNDSTGRVHYVYAEDIAGITFPTSSTFDRDEYNLIGWSRNALTEYRDFENIILPEAVQSTEERATYYAVWKPDDAYFIPGSTFNSKIKQLAGQTGADSSTDNTTIKKIEWATQAPSASNMSAANIVSTADSPYEIYAWFENGTIKLYTEAETHRYLNESSDNMFKGLNEATSIDLTTMDSSKVTNMTRMFNDCKKLTSVDLSGFNTENVTNMDALFMGCNTLTSVNLQGVNTAKVENMNSMFGGCTSLASVDLSGFVTTNLTTMAYIFQNCSSLQTIDLSSFNTGKVTNMDAIFMGCTNATTINTSSFNTARVTNMNSMFRDCTNLTTIDLSHFNTASLTTMNAMFYNCNKATSIDVSSFDTSHVQDMDLLFGKCSLLTSLDVSNFNTTNVTTMRYMFSDMTSLTKLDLYSFSTPNLTDTYAMFIGSSNLQKVYAKPEFDVSHVTNSEYMFAGCTAIVGSMGTTFDGAHIEKEYAHVDGGTSNPGYFSEKFAIFAPGQEVNQKLKRLAGNTSATSTTADSTITSIEWSTTPPTSANMQEANLVSSTEADLPIYAWFENGTIKLYTEPAVAYTNINSSDMFRDLRVVKNIDLTRINTRNTTIMSGMFCKTGYNSTSITLNGLSAFDVSKVTNMADMFNSFCYNMTNFDLSAIEGWNVSNVTNMSSMFNSAGYKASRFDLDLSGWNMGKVQLLYFTFASSGHDASYWSLGDLSGWNTSSFTNLNGTFKESGYKATTWYIGNINSWDVSKVTTMDSLFYDACYKDSNWTLGDFSGWQTTSLTNAGALFANAGYNCNSFVIDVSDWDMSKCTWMNSLFYFCGFNATTWSIGDLSGWDTSKNRSIGWMFICAGGHSSSVDINFIKDWDVSNVTEMTYAFNGLGVGTTSKYALDLSGWDTSKATSTKGMFSYCVNLKIIYASDKWVTTNVTDSTDMFKGSVSLVGGNGTTFSSSHIDKEYARIDGYNDLPGYFWCHDEYQVTFNANAGSATVTGMPTANKTKVYGVKLNLPETPARTGYTFLGWSENASSTTATYTTTSGYTKNAAATLCAIWQAKTYTVTLDGNNGSGGTASVTATYDSAMPTATMPTRTGYSFQGFYDTSAATGGTQYYKADGTSARTWNKVSNTTLYARWKANTYTVTLDGNNGSGGTASVTATYDSTMPTATMPTRTGYSFQGFYDTSAATGGTQYYKADGTSARTWNKTSNTTLYARWKANTYTVTLDGNNGSGGTASVTATYSSAMPTATMPTRTGYTFQGFYDTSAATGGTQYYKADGTSARTWNKTSNTTLYARWKANTYTVTLDGNNGSGGTASVTATYDSAMPTATMPTRTGYIFQGFYDTSDSTGGTQYYKADGTSARTWNKTSNTTLHARWILSTCTVTLDGNNGSGGTASVTATYGSAMPTATMPTRTGYTFQGFYDTSASTGGTQYYKADGTSARTWNKTSNTTLYARWKANTYTVTLDGNNGSGGTASVTATYGSAMPTATMPTRTGYSFQGFYDTSAATGGTQYYKADGTSARTWNKASNTTLYARWKGNTYTVTLNRNGGSGGTDSVTATYGSAMPAATMPTRSGYKFMGYYDTSNASGGTQYYTEAGASARAWNKTSNTTLYARWAQLYNLSGWTARRESSDIPGHPYDVRVVPEKTTALYGEVVKFNVYAYNDAYANNATVFLEIYSTVNSGGTETDARVTHQYNGNDRGAKEVYIGYYSITIKGNTSGRVYHLY